MLSFPTDVTHWNRKAGKFNAVFSFGTNLIVPTKNMFYISLFLLAAPPCASASHEKEGMHDTERKTLFLISAELHLIICSRCQNWGRKSFSSVLGLQSNCGERFRKRGKEKRANQRMPDSSCMGDESRIQNVPSLADVKSHKMAHYRDRKGARWSNKPHVSLKQNDKGRGTERWHCNIPTVQLLLNWDFGRIILIRKRRLWRKFHTWMIYPTTHCVETGSAGWRAVRGRGDSRANLFPWLHLRLKRQREGMEIR